MQLNLFSSVICVMTVWRHHSVKRVRCLRQGGMRGFLLGAVITQMGLACASSELSSGAALSAAERPDPASGAEQVSSISELPEPLPDPSATAQPPEVAPDNRQPSNGSPASADPRLDPTALDTPDENEEEKGKHKGKHKGKGHGRHGDDDNDDDD